MDIQFCRECNNLMSQKIESGNLLYVCTKCDTLSEPEGIALSTICFKKQHDTSASRKQDLIEDKTLPRLNATCQRCGHGECVGYLEKSEDRALNFYYVCTKCFNEWTD